MVEKINLKKLDGTYAIAQIAPQNSIPDWADGDGFVSISRTDDELSVVCLEQRIPPDVKNGWRMDVFQISRSLCFRCCRSSSLCYSPLVRKWDGCFRGVNIRR